MSLFASNGISGSFYIVCEQDANTGTGSSTSSCDLNSPFNDFQGVGGTSASSPAFAGIIALVNHLTGQRQGNVNYVLYPLAAKAGATCTSAANPAGTCIFYDIPAGSNISVACQTLSTNPNSNCSNTSTASNAFGIMTTTTGGTNPAYQTTAGYDLATGLGSVNVTNLLNNWTAASFRGTNTTFSLNGGTPVVTSHGTAISVSGAVTPQTGTGTPTGLVELIQGTTSPGVVIDTFVLSNGSYSGNTSMLPGTTTGYQVIAHYEGDGTFAASNSAAQTVTTVSKENSAVKVSLVTTNSAGNPVLTTSATTLAYGSSYTLQIAVTNSAAASCAPPPFAGGPCPTGSITLLDNGQALNDFLKPNTSTATNQAALNNAGVAEDQPIQLGAGSHSITATYTGDASFNAQPTSNSLSLTITQATTATAVTSSSTSISSGGSVTLTATISSNSNSTQGPTGAVQFFNGSTAIGSAATCKPAGANPSTNTGASCTATLSTTLSMLLPPGSNSRRRFTPPWGPLVLLAFLAMFLAYAATRIAGTRRRGYVYATAILLIAGAIGFAGCGGGSSGGSHTDSITAKYAGDTNYSSSTSSAVSITIQ